MTCNELKEVCRAYGLTVGGCKDDLIGRLQPFMTALSNFDGSEVSGIDDSESSDSDDS
jgi:hypothetical protein